MKLEFTNFNLDVIKHRAIYLSISTVAIAISILSLVFSWQTTGLPLKPALDFIGGTKLSYELVCAPTPTSKCGQPLEIAPIRQTMAAQGFKDLVIQLSGQDGRGLLVQTAKLGLEERSRIQSSLTAAVSQYGTLDPTKIQIDEVGPVIGQQLLSSGLLALMISFIGIAIYLAVRFQPDYATFAIVALCHDVLITTGTFALLGLTLGVEVDSLFVVAILTICGFSVNDTVIIYDRIRENLNSLGAEQHFNQIVNLSINQSLARSINTTLTTVLPLITIFIFGGATLKYFALALIIGFSAGAYSSIFNASILLAWWRNRTN